MFCLLYTILLVLNVTLIEFKSINYYFAFLPLVLDGIILIGIFQIPNLSLNYCFY